MFCLATNEIAQTGLSSLPPVIYYSEQLFSYFSFLLIFTDFTFSSQKPIFPSQIPRIFCPLHKGSCLPQGWRGAGCIEGAR
ncbi:hypothetical protein E3D14_03585 [Aeromonas salmonicida subsp. salmonicida]|nr:hypothetical protein E3D14_03585 [Aeromonas salmonicida subsp. salmonicida]